MLREIISMNNGSFIKNIKSFCDKNNYKSNLEYANLYNTSLFNNIILNSLDFNVPQKRERVFILAYKQKFNLSPTLPKSSSTNILTVYDAISDLPKINSGEGCEEMEYSSLETNEYQKLMRKNSNVLL